MLVKKRLLTTVIDRPTLGCFKKVGGVRGRLCKTGFDCLVLLRVGFFVAEVLFNVCVLLLRSYVVPYIYIYIYICRDAHQRNFFVAK